MAYELKLFDVPPSFNKVGHTGSRWAWTRAKKQWQGDIEIALMASQIPRGLMQVRASARLYFDTNRRRDEGNYRVLLEKCLGDALVNGKWLPDDTADFYSFGKVETGLRSAGKPYTILVLDCPPAAVKAA
jgi:hypothetical protein